MGAAGPRSAAGRRVHRTASRVCRAPAAGAARRRSGGGQHAAGRCWRQPLAPGARGLVCGAVRRLTGGCFVRPTASSPAQPRRQPRRQPSPVGHRAGAPALRPTDSRVCSPADAAGSVQARDFAMPQAVYRPGDLSHPALATADSHPRSDACGFCLTHIGASMPPARASSARSKQSARRKTWPPSRSPRSWSSTSPASTTRCEDTPAWAT